MGKFYSNNQLSYNIIYVCIRNLNNNKVIKNSLDNYLIPPLKMVVWCT
jgi:hypothetical protein